jgi:hypothetical protein
METPGFKEAVDNAEQALKLNSAFTEGQRAGYLDVPPGLNPFVFGTLEHSEWARGHETTFKEVA